MTAIWQHSRVMASPSHGGMTATVLRNISGQEVTTAFTRVNVASTITVLNRFTCATATRPSLFLSTIPASIRPILIAYSNKTEIRFTNNKTIM